jgi:cytochrome c peroxidase
VISRSIPRRARRRAVLALTVLLLAACTERDVLAPESIVTESSLSQAEVRQLVREVRELARARDITRMAARPKVVDGLADLGQMLLFDKLLSGNRDISCMSCHIPELATGDSRSLSIGQGATGLGGARVHPTDAFIPRNAPPLFNLHLSDHLFWDGRVAIDPAGNFHTPAGALLTREMTSVLQFGAVSALGLFPVLSREEMRGSPGENELADIPDRDMTGIWAALMDRLGAIPQYRELFETAYPGTGFHDMTFAHASNAMAGFLLKSFAFDNTPWDRLLAGNDAALTIEQLEGAVKFMNAPCAQCHNGPGFSDDDFHNVALAQFGPGHGNGPSGRDDFGRLNVTGDPNDIYRFRSTMLRNVELTGPYGHAGEFADLALFIDHYSSSADKLRAYSAADVPEPLLRESLLADNREAIIATRDPLILPVAFDSVFTRQVSAFMLALTDRRARDLSHFTPRRVPSGIPTDR